MIDGRPSNTAFQVAAARAAHLRFDPAPHLLEDSLAHALLDDEGREMIHLYADDGPWIMRENRLFVPLRGRLVEDRLAEAYARGVRQLVVLGAGLDSIAWRQSELLPQLRVYEIDHPSTQSWKVDRLASLGWGVPDNVRMVACDFEQETAGQALAKTDFDANAPAFVSWMGVVYYLERATADTAMKELASLLAPGSTVVLDFMLPWEALSERYHEVRKAMVQYLKGAGEPHINRYDPADMRLALDMAGFASLEIFDREAFLAAYPRLSGFSPSVSERFLIAIASR